MSNTPNSPETQAQPEGDAQPDIGQVIMGSIILDEAQQLAVYRAAREAIDRLPGVSWADKGFLGALVGRLDFTKGVVRDGHEWLAKWFNTSLSAVRRRREALDDAGHIHDRECKVEGGNITNEIALPIVAMVTLERGDARFRAPHGCSISGTNEVGVSRDREITLQHATLSTESGELAKKFPEPTKLKSWKADDYWRERGFAYRGEVKMEEWRLDYWQGRVAHHGGAPAHVTTAAAYFQVVELAHELDAILGLGVPGRMINALAYRVTKAHKEKRQIGSLAFIARRLAHLCQDGDDTWIYDLPFQIPQERQERAARLANKALAAMDKASIGANRRTLLATAGIEDLDAWIEYYTYDIVDAGIEREIAAGAPGLGENHSIAGWAWFDDAIKAARNEHQERSRKPTQGRRMMTDAEMRAEWARQRAVAAEKLAAMREIAAAGVEQLRAAGIEAEEHRLLITSEVNDLASRLHRAADTRQALTAVIECFLAAPHRRDVKAWSNLHKAFDAALAGAAKASA